MKVPKIPAFRFRWKRIVLLLGIVFLSVLLVLAGMVLVLAAQAPDIDSITVSPTESATYICASDGSYLRKLTLAESNRDLVTLDQIPESLQQAVIAIEDARFYTHNGIDVRGILRAFWNGIKSGSFSEGASTITQQLIKNNVFTEWTQENSFADRLSRKVQEQYLALQLEKKLSKEEILEDYLNTINLGAGCYGVQSAANRYFGKDVSELTLAESAVLAAIPQNPTAYNPILYPQANQNRQQTVLRYMCEQGYITQEELEEALAEDVYAHISTYNDSYEESSPYSYYEDALISQVCELLVTEKGYSSEQAYRAVYSGGLRIFTAQDDKLQEICEEEFQNAANFPEGTQYGVDYALSVVDSDGQVTHYGSSSLRSYVREHLNSSFSLLCSSQEEAQSYADAFRTWVLSEEADSEKSDNPEELEESDNPEESGASDNPENSDASDNPEDSDVSDNSESSLSVLAERLDLTLQPQASLVLIEQSTGYVRAIVGGRGEKTASLTLNRATETTRQPGSTFKILTAYAPALELAGKTLASTYENQPFSYTDGTAVSNWDINNYSDPVTIREAITRSINVAAVRCITEITPRTGFDFACSFGISTLVESADTENGVVSDVVQPLALGGITNGVTNLELCSAYAAIANGGLYQTPRFFTKVLDRHGNVLLDSQNSQSASEQSGTSRHSNLNAATDTSLSSTSRISRRVLSESTAFLLTSAMESVVTDEQGTAYGTISAAGQPVAGKTGTTSDYKDIWFVGYTPYYTCCVWGGYDNNQALPLYSIAHTYSRVLWSAVMDRIHASLPAASFVQPETVVSVTLCSDSHLPAVLGSCPDTYEEYFADGTVPEQSCTLHPLSSSAQIEALYSELQAQLATEAQAEKETAAGTEADTQAGAETDTEAGTQAGTEMDTEAGTQAGTETDTEASGDETGSSGLLLTEPVLPPDLPQLNLSQEQSENETADASETDSGAATDSDTETESGINDSGFVSEFNGTDYDSGFSGSDTDSEFSETGSGETDSGSSSGTESGVPADSLQDLLNRLSEAQ